MCRRSDAEARQRPALHIESSSDPDVHAPILLHDVAVIVQMVARIRKRGIGERLALRPRLPNAPLVIWIGAAATLRIGRVRRKAPERDELATVVAVDGDPLSVSHI